MGGNGIWSGSFLGRWRRSTWRCGWVVGEQVEYFGRAATNPSNKKRLWSIGYYLYSMCFCAIYGSYRSSIWIFRNAQRFLESLGLAPDHLSRALMFFDLAPGVLDGCKCFKWGLSYMAGIFSRICRRYEVIKRAALRESFAFIAFRKAAAPAASSSSSKLRRQSCSMGSVVFREALETGWGVWSCSVWACGLPKTVVWEGLVCQLGGTVPWESCFFLLGSVLLIISLVRLVPSYMMTFSHSASFWTGEHDIHLLNKNQYLFFHRPTNLLQTRTERNQSKLTQKAKENQKKESPKQKPKANHQTKEQHPNSQTKIQQTAESKNMQTPTCEQTKHIKHIKLSDTNLLSLQDAFDQAADDPEEIEEARPAERS